MELALNIIWVCVSIAAFVAIVRRSRRRAFAVTVAVCLAAIAFPIISMSDDLCNEFLLADPFTVKRAPRRVQPPPLAIVADVVRSETLSIVSTCFGTVAVTLPTTPRIHAATPVAERGPPLLCV